MPEISIVMPAYNEEKNISETVRRCGRALSENRLDGEIVVTNDGSRDGTRKILDALAEEFPNLKAIHREKNSGYGSALSRSIRHSSGEYVVTIDSDGQFDILELPLLYDEMKKGYDVVTGFRKKKKDSAFRIFADRCLNLIMRITFGMQLRDTNCAFKIFNGDLIRRLKIESMGFSTPTEIMIKLQSAGCRIGEVGITHAFREKGSSSLHSFRTSMHMLMFLFYMKLKQKLFQKKIIQDI